MTRSFRDFLSVSGEMAERIRAHDWSATRLGDPERWPLSLKTAIRIMLSSRYAMWMLWGPELTFFCNDAYLPTVGLKRDWVLGARSDRVWEEIWSDIGPRIRRVLSTGEATWDEGLLLFLERSGFTEETYHTFSYSPLADDEGQICGMLCVVTEETERLIGERRLKVLRDLGLRLGQVRVVADVWEAISACLAEESRELPFTLAYIQDPEEHRARLVCATGVTAGSRIAPELIALHGRESTWPILPVLEGEAAVRVPELASRFGQLPPGAWNQAPRAALLLPLAAQGQSKPLGVFVIGLNPYRPLDAAYRGFLDLFTAQVAAGLASALAYEAERLRAEALAEIDRAKTAFFSNVSHEFRTPLTLMLGPLEELLSKPTEIVPTDARRLVDIAHRNGQRLLRLVNALLDFARLESGRTKARFQATDLALLTSDLASSFRSATDRAGLALAVDCAPLDEPAFVDREMWEKIVLNLLSNAFKFTFKGGITVRLRAVADRIHLIVEDTGTGIAAEDLPRLFERFHRVEGARGRSFEGSGIGLALVRELAGIHGGEVSVESTPGIGSRFTIDIPRGSAHLPAAQIETAAKSAPDNGRAEAFVQEALHWLPDEILPDVSSSSEDRRGLGEKILLVDDNADLRNYISRLLGERGYQVVTAGDGEEALLELSNARPDLILTDVMMPKMDGFSLLRAIRSDAALRELPVILLSARAGEEARVEGIEAGAEDYLTKPFAARELLARVGANLSLARMRREVNAALVESESRFRNMADHAPIMLCVTGPDGACDYFNRAWYEFTGQEESAALGSGWLTVVHAEDRETARSVVGGTLPQRAEYRLRRKDGVYRWIASVAAPRFSAEGASLGYISSLSDITERKDIEGVLRQRVEEAVAARAEVEDALRQAQKMEALGQLTGGIAHDFNNLLTVITGSFGIAMRALDAAGVIAPRAQRALENGLKGAERAASLTHRLLAFSRRQPLAPKPIDVDKLVSGMSDLLHRALGETIELETVTSPGLWRIEVDPNQLESALLNLAVNARDAMPAGGKLTIETANARLNESYAAAHSEVAPGLYVVIAVTDTGEGMTRETLDRVFEPFFTTKPVGKGTGLGLSMVYGFTKQSGGHVKIYSEPNLGTTVKIYLPRLMTVNEEAPETPRDELDRSPREVTILVVEDDDDVRAYSCEVLRELGYRVLDAPDGLSALKVIEKKAEPIALLFTDVVMPGMSGSELAEKARATLPELKVLYTSGYTRNAIVHGGRLDSGVDMIVKPFTYHALGEKISDVLDAGSTGRVLIASSDVAALRLGSEALRASGYAVDEAQSAADALSRVRVSQGGYDAAIVDDGFGERIAYTLALELRALRSDLPILLVDGASTSELKTRLTADRCVAFFEKPYAASRLREVLSDLGVRCGSLRR